MGEPFDPSIVAEGTSPYIPDFLNHIFTVSAVNASTCSKHLQIIWDRTMRS